MGLAAGWLRSVPFCGKICCMGGDGTDGYLDGLTPEQAQMLGRVNKPGLIALREYLGSGEAIAFLGAGSRPRCTRRGTG